MLQCRNPGALHTVTHSFRRGPVPIKNPCRAAQSRGQASPPFAVTAAPLTPSRSAAVLVFNSRRTDPMNAQRCANMFEDTLNRIRRAVADLRRAIADGTAADPKAAAELADRMERYVATANDNGPADEASRLPLF